MSKKGVETKEKILDTAQSMILDHGFSGVSVDKLISDMGVTKGAFFHHFKSKNEMATNLIDRYARDDMEFFNNAMARGEKLSNDPLQQLLISVGLYEEMFAELADPYPGCLLASYIQEAQIFHSEVQDIINNVFLRWRGEMLKRLKVIAKKYPPDRQVDLQAVADEFVIIIEGSFIVSKSLKDTKIIPQQLRNYKQYLELLFQNKN